MMLTDVNVLIYAHRAEMEQHSVAYKWLQGVVSSGEAYGLSDLVVSSFLRIVTHPSAFDPPSTMKQALSFAAEIREAPNRVAIEPGDRHWEIFVELGSEPGVKGPLVTDAYLAALAIEHQCDFVTNDGDFKRFAPRLKIVNPLGP
jgi:toxin-antitoxin system PIN domain toxin